MTLSVAEHMQSGIARTTRTIERGPGGRVRKGISPPSEDIKLWRETRTRDTDDEDDEDDELEVTMIRVPVSSTGKDRDGDRFSETGLEHMVEQFRSGQVPLYANHGLDPETGWPEYRFEHQMGGWKDAEIEEEDGTKVVFATAALSPDNEQAQVLERQIENGIVPVSFSVGFMPQNSDTITNEEGEVTGREFHEHDLFETSSVGVPSNTDATIAAQAQAHAKGAAAVAGIDDPEAINRMARSIEAAVKSGEPLDDPLDSVTNENGNGKENEHMDKEPADAIPIVEAYLDQDGTDTSDDLATFLAWVEETDRDMAAAEDAVSAYLDEVDADDPSEETVGTLQSWLQEEFGEDEEEEGEGNDGDEDEDEEGEDETEGGDDGGEDDDEEDGVEAATVDDVRSVVQEELDPIRSMLEDLVEDEANGADGSEADAEVERLESELEDLRDEVEDLETENEELQRQLDEAEVEIRDPKGARKITRAERDSTDGAGQEDSTQTTDAEDHSGSETDDSLDDLRRRIKEARN